MLYGYDKMSFIELLKEFRDLGCKNEAKVALACRIYVDLKDVVEIKNLEKFFNPDYDAIFLQGDSEEGTNIYVPHPTCDIINLKELESIQKKICENGTKSLTLCICDPSSTILYYKLSKGWTE